MKKLLVSTILILTFLTTQEAKAQNYNTAIGLAIDLGNGPTLVGPQIKHSFDGKNAGNAQILFGSNSTTIGVDYSYNEQLPGVSALYWYVGVGPQLTFNDGTWVAIRPAVGLEYKIPTAPIGFHFDWKPWWNLSKESDFEAGRFTLGFKYILK